MYRIPSARRVAVVASAAVLVLGLAACTASSKDSDSDNGEGEGEPRVVATKFGDIEVPADPQKVVALGWGDAETALALGVQPIGASDWIGFGDGTDGVGPWAQGLYDESPEMFGTMELDTQAIGALEPDLILDVRSSGDKKRYDALTEITPAVVSVPEGGDNYLTTPDQQLDMIAQALGKEDEADQLSEDLDQTFADAQEEHPEFDGKTVTVSAYSSEGWSVYREGDARVDFMQNLGFTQKPEVEDLESDAFFVPLSNEQIDVLDADVMVSFPIFVDASEIDKDSLYQALPAVEDGRALVIEDQDLSNAFSLGTTLATEYAIEEVAPQLSEIAK